MKLNFSTNERGIVMTSFAPRGHEITWKEREGWEGGAGLTCPVCGDGNHHVELVSTERSADADEAHMYPGTSIEVVEGKSWRRSAVRIDIRGECGHCWTLLIQQHKGALFLIARTPEGLPTHIDRNDVQMGRVDEERRPECSPSKVFCCGVLLKSRYEKLDEYRVMSAMIEDLSPEDRAMVGGVLCDSKAQCCYMVALKRSDAPVARRIGRSMEATAMRVSGGHNGIELKFVAASDFSGASDVTLDVIDPQWDEDAAEGMWIYSSMNDRAARPRITPLAKGSQDAG